VFITKGPPKTTGSRKGLPAKNRTRAALPFALIAAVEGASSLGVSQANSPEATGRSCLPTIAGLELWVRSQSDFAGFRWC
jgi:hypothetical protein